MGAEIEGIASSEMDAIWRPTPNDPVGKIVDEVFGTYDLMGLDRSRAGALQSEEPGKEEDCSGSTSWKEMGVSYRSWIAIRRKRRKLITRRAACGRKRQWAHGS